jgi:hypothetical protein
MALPDSGGQFVDPGVVDSGDIESLITELCAPLGVNETEMTLLTLRTLLRRLVGNPSTANVPQSELTLVINIAFKDIVAKYRFHRARTICFVDTEVGQDRYFIPRDVGILKKVWNQTLGCEIRKAGIKGIINSEPTGEPTHYHRIGRVLHLRPVPDEVWRINMYYHRMVADLVEDTDVPVIPSVWHIGLLIYAVYWYWTFRQDYARAQIALNNWKVWVSDKPTEVDEELIDSDIHTELPTRPRRRWHRASIFTNFDQD